MERITLNHNSKLKSIIFAGLEAQGFALIEKMTGRRTPIYLFHNRNSGIVAIYHSRAGDDELLLLDCNKPGKMKVIISEFEAYGDNDFTKAAKILTDILDTGKTDSVTTVNIPRL